MSSFVLPALGTVAGLGARPLLTRLLLAKFARDVERLNAGDYSSLLAAYADDAVLLFHDGPHRWAGPGGGRYVGKRAIASFLDLYVGAGVQGRIVDVLTSGAPWRLTLVARFDDHAEDPGGRRIYENRAVIVLTTRWGKIVEHEDFYTDTQRLIDFDRALSTTSTAWGPTEGRTTGPA